MKNGFSECGICLRDYEGRAHIVSVMISTVQAVNIVSGPFPEMIIVTTDTPAATKEGEVASHLNDRLLSLGTSAGEVVAFQDIRCRNIKNNFLVILLEMEQQFLYDIQKSQLEALQEMIKSAKGILWLTCGKEEKPQFGLITGLARSLYSEYPNMTFIELAIQRKLSSIDVAQKLADVLLKTFHDAAPHESEYMKKDGVLYINRIVDANYLNNTLKCVLFQQVFQSALERALERAPSPPHHSC